MYPNIRALREDNDLTQTQVAHYLNMSQTGYSKYETGENDIPTRVLLSLSDLYGENIDYLLYDPERPHRKHNNDLQTLKQDNGHSKL